MIALEYRRIEPGEGHEAGRALLRKMYRDHRGTEIPAVVLEERGKPRFVEDPLEFSISHTISFNRSPSSKLRYSNNSCSLIYFQKSPKFSKIPFPNII